MCIVVSNNITIGRYYPVNSIIHRMNPLAKIICTILFSIITISFFNYFLPILLILILISTNIPISMYVKSIDSLKWFLVSILILNLLLTSNIFLAVTSVLKIIYLVLFSNALILTTPISEINFGLINLFKPLKIFNIPINQMALSITLAIRFIPSILDSANQIKKSQISRGISFQKLNYKEKINNLQTLIIPLFSLTLKKADDLSESMETRLYDINKTRINFRQNKWGMYDTFLVSTHISLLLLMMRGI